MEQEGTVISQPMEPESVRDWGRGARAARLALFSVFFCIVLAVLFFLVSSLTRNREVVRVLYDPEQFFEQGGKSGKPMEGKKNEILTSLNEELDHSSDLQQPEENRLLAQLDRLWRSFKNYLSPKQKEKAGGTQVASTGGIPESRQALATSGGPRVSSPEEARKPDVLDDVLRLANDPALIQRASLPAKTRGESERKQNGGDPGSSSGAAARGEELPSQAGSRLFRKLLPMEGVRTRGLVWQLHRNLSLEGTLDTSQVGETDQDLRDFGLRSVDALGFLRDNPRPSYTMGWDKIDSGYPRSYGIGLNLRVSPAMQMLFDYSHEYPNDHFIEYKGDWESSLMADYAKKRPDEIPSVHSFFFGLRYLHREREALLPVQTGFFYSTDMAQDPLPSEVSMGFSLGGGVHRKDMQLGLSYRLRIWQNPAAGLLSVQDAQEQQQLTTRISNQVLFYLTF